MVKSALQAFLKDCRIGLSAYTLRNYSYNLQRLAAFLREQHVGRLDRITSEHLRAYLTRFQELPIQKRVGQKPPSKATVHQVYRVMRTWLNWCVRQQLIVKNPLLSVRAPELPRPVARHLSQANMGRLIEVCAQTTRPERDRAIVLVFLDTGLRLQELAGMQLSDVDLAGRRLTVRLSKGGKGRVVPISSVAAHALAAWLVARPEQAGPALFGLKRQGVYQLIIRLRRRAGLEALAPHMLRHTFATFYDGDIYDLAKILGHSDIKVTAEVYAHREAARLAAVHDARSPIRQVVTP